MAIKATELATDFVSNGVKVSAGQSADAVTRKTIVAQYPAERAAGHDGSVDLQVHDLYKNGLLFTAYNYDSRTTQGLRDFRKKTNNKAVIDWNPLKFMNIGGLSKFNQDAVANLLLPRSISDVDNITHRFNDVGESLAQKGGGTVTGALSNMASSAVFGAIEGITQGIMADYGEQIYTSARSMYAGPDHRTKVFSWRMTPRSVQDLVQILRIYETFAYFSYGQVGTSNFAKDIKGQLDDWYKRTFIKPGSPEGADTSGTMFENITEFLSNVITVSNPTIWVIKNFGRASHFDGKTDVFGPAQISSIRFDKVDNGQFNGLAIAPNMPSTFTLEVTFREIMTLNRDVLFAEGM